jgi:hypothetical protein
MELAGILEEVSRAVLSPASGHVPLRTWDSKRSPFLWVPPPAKWSGSMCAPVSALPRTRRATNRAVGRSHKESQRLAIESSEVL